MNLLAKPNPVKKIEDFAQETENIKLLTKVEQAQTKGGGCRCNEKRIRRRY